MTPRRADYIEAGKALDADERLEAAYQLLLSVDRDVDATEAEVASSWDATIDRRVEDIGTATRSLLTGARRTLESALRSRPLVGDTAEAIIRA